MDWENERYVRLYTRDTTSWVMWRWEARALLPLLMRKMDRAGRISLDKHGIRGLAHLVGLPIEVTQAGLDELLDDGCLVQEGDCIVMPNFVAGQTARQSAALRKAEQRARDKLAAESRAVTHVREVTRCDTSHSSLAEPSLTKDPPLPPASQGEETQTQKKRKREKPEPPPGFTEIAEEVCKLSGVSYPESAFEGLRERLREHSLDDLLAYVRWAARDEWLGKKIQLKPSVLFRKARCAEGVAAAKANPKPAPRSAANDEPEYCRRLL